MTRGMRDATADSVYALTLLSCFLEEAPASIHEAEVCALAEAVGFSHAHAYAYLLASMCGLDPECRARDMEVLRQYFVPMTRALDTEAFLSDAYYANIRVPNASDGDCALGTSSYAPYEAFVCGDLRRMPDGRVLPQIGFFSRPFSYPVIREKGREWMTVTPNEIETMQAPLARATGDVLTYGLGLGYFAYMAAREKSVRSVTVVEKNESVIRLFMNHIFPQIPERAKISIVQDDAFDFARTRAAREKFDFVFADLWHDASDGIPMRDMLRKLENRASGASYAYWIDETLDAYEYLFTAPSEEPERFMRG